MKMLPLHFFECLVVSTTIPKIIKFSIKILNFIPISITYHSEYVLDSN